MSMVGEGYYSALYFNKSRQILKGLPPKHVTMQVFQKQDAILSGMDQAVKCIRNEADNADSLKIMALSDGDRIAPWEPVMTIEGNLADFVHLESVYLGMLARGTRVATNVNKVVAAAEWVPVIFMADRFDHFMCQALDGYSAMIGGAASVVTEAMTRGFVNQGIPCVGTMPHALIAAFDGDVVAACKAYHNEFPDEGITALVDFNNDCVGDSLRCLNEFGDDLHAVRLDTSEKLIDKSLHDSGLARAICFGVNEHLVRNVRNALDNAGGEHVRIIVSGGFTPEKINNFVQRNVPVDAYGVGSSLIKNGGDFTADIVVPVAKTGRGLGNTSRLKEV